ncbi:MAG: zinc-dependent alcohol dehydrogenase [Pseudonocardiales bacterium]
MINSATHTADLLSTGPLAWPSGQMMALTIAAPGKITLSSIAIPPPRPGTALVRPELVGLCGTDLELFHGTASYIRDGRAPYPIVFGHEWCGVVAAVGPDTTGITVGDRVVGHTMLSCGRCRMCQGGHRNLCEDLSEVGLYGQQGAAAEFLRMPASALTKLPVAVTDRAAALVEPAVTVVGGLDQVGCGLADRVAVLGTGTIGLLAIQLAVRLAGTVHAIGIDDAGLELAGHCGAHQMLRPEEAEPGAYSLVIEASGASSAFARGLHLLEPGGRMALIGVAGEPLDGLVPGDIALRGIDIVGIRHGLDYYDRTIKLMVDGVLNPELLIADVLAPDDAQRAFERLEHGRSGRPKLLLRFGGSVHPKEDHST